MTTMTMTIVQLGILVMIVPTIPGLGSRVLADQVGTLIPICQAIQEWVNRTP